MVLDRDPRRGRTERPSRARAVVALLSILLLASCAESSASLLDARGPAAARINTLWWILFGVGAAVYLAVMGYLLAALFQRRPAGFDETEQ